MSSWREILWWVVCAVAGLLLMAWMAGLLDGCSRCYSLGGLRVAKAATPLSSRPCYSRRHR